MLWNSWKNPISTTTAGKGCLNGFVTAEKQANHIWLHSKYQQIFSLTKKKAFLIPVAVFLLVAPEKSLFFVIVYVI